MTAFRKKRPRRGPACGALLSHCAFVTALVWCTAAAQPDTVDYKFDGRSRRLLAAYETHGEKPFLEQAKRFGVRIGERKGESCIPLVIEPVRGVVPAGFDRRRLESSGIAVEAASRSYLRVLVPAGRLRTLAEHPQVGRIMVPARPRAFACTTGLGSTISQAVYRTRADSFQMRNFTGGGVKVAVVDVGFLGIDSAIAHGDLPSSTVRIDLPGSADNPLAAVSDHGTAIAEHVMDMAPGALLHCIRVTDQTDFENARDTLKARGIRIANHSLGWLGGSYYDDSGPITRIVNGSHDTDGVFWTVASGNEAQAHWRGSWLDGDADSVLNFLSNDENLLIPRLPDHRYHGPLAHLEPVLLHAGAGHGPEPLPVRQRRRKGRFEHRPPVNHEGLARGVPYPDLPFERGPPTGSRSGDAAGPRPDSIFRSWSLRANCATHPPMPIQRRGQASWNRRMRTAPLPSAR